MELTPDDFKLFVSGIVGAFASILGAIWKMLNDRIKGLVANLEKHRDHVSAFYPTRQETRDSFANLIAGQEKMDEKLDKQNDMLIRIFEQLGQKEDRRK